MVKDEEITFNREESAHPGMALFLLSIALPLIQKVEARHTSHKQAEND